MNAAALERLQRDNERLREALRLIRDLADTQRLVDVGRIARAALISAEPENPGLRPCGLTNGGAHA
ncbi:MAG TPA: hypothetical protein VGH74_07685 [Planctomycetaceae bacterium]|jgi:hypothetical protein